MHLAITLQCWWPQKCIFETLFSTYQLLLASVLGHCTVQGQMGTGAYDELLDVDFGIEGVWMFGLQIWMSKICFSSAEREQMLHSVIFCWFSSRQEHSTMFLYLSVTWIKKKSKIKKKLKEKNPSFCFQKTAINRRGKIIKDRYCITTKRTSF